MNDDVDDVDSGELRLAVDYRGGYIGFTKTHLVVERGGAIVEYLLLRKLSDLSREEAHSFRHRSLGLIAGAILMYPLASVILPGKLLLVLPLLILLKGKLGVGVLFSVFFGILFLWCALTSRIIPWINLRYAGTPKHIPLPDAAMEEVEDFLFLLRQAMDEARVHFATGESSTTNE